uniref:Speriolin-like protein n=1 Tax=Callorhinchus milii TaxID=7868 RepID=A0A4W3IMJ2_CALMI|eukprot:gi/632959091/ref/XP_007895426.1/ PREDICTED: speriolin-like protein [Callorhinchus milii]
MIFGEIAFQLDRRILSYVFTAGVRLYGFRVTDINNKIKQVATSQVHRNQLLTRNNQVMARLQNAGYNPGVHDIFAETIVNAYGILKEKPKFQSLANLNDPNYLRNMINQSAPANIKANMLLLVNCLWSLSTNDGRPMFIW